MTTAAITLTGLPRLGLDTDLLIKNLGHVHRVYWYIELWHDLDTLNQWCPWLTSTSDRELENEFAERLPRNHHIHWCKWAWPQNYARPPRTYEKFFSTPEHVWLSRKLSQHANLIRRCQQVSTDLVIRARTDSAPHEPVSLKAMHDLLKSHQNWILCNENQRQSPLQYTDHICIGLEPVMNLIYDLVDLYDHAHSLGIPYNAEWLDSALLKPLNIEWPLTDFMSTLKTLQYTDDEGITRNRPGSWQYPAVVH